MKSKPEKSNQSTDINGLRELRKTYWDIRQDEKDDVNHEDEAVARIEAYISKHYIPRQEVEEALKDVYHMRADSEIINPYLAEIRANLSKKGTDDGNS